ncbi:MAG: hypothetical protein HND52_20440 [Ignavibacteriae bacterium]|nr:hypothetical protein [Ignavibacteriota bacterium]NOH00341.1 hypothetical protein [Ignavibacteriota bacterium]
MKKFFVRLVIFLVIFFLVDQALSKILDIGRPPDYKAFIESKSEYNSESGFDILFIGDSQTADNFVPAVFEEKLGYSAFNFGVYNMSPFEGYYLTKDLIERSSPKPKLVVLGTEVNMFYFMVSDGRFTPFFIENPLNLIPLLIKSDSFESFTSAGRKGYLFKPTLKKILTGKTSGTVDRDVVGVDNGYLKNIKHFSNYAKLTNCTKNWAFLSNEFVQVQKDYFIKTIEYLRKKDIKVVFANTPMHPAYLECFKSKPRFDEYKKIMEDLSETYGIEQYNPDYEVLLGEFEDEDFLNGDHLCYSGAKIFSSVFADYLNENIFSQIKQSFAVSK